MSYRKQICLKKGVTKWVNDVEKKEEKEEGRAWRVQKIIFAKILMNKWN